MCGKAEFTSVSPLRTIEQVYVYLGAYGGTLQIDEAQYNKSSGEPIQIEERNKMKSYLEHYFTHEELAELILQIIDHGDEQ